MRLRFTLRTAIATASLVALGQTSAFATPYPQARAARPNLVIFLADDLGNDIPPWGDSNARAPNIARLAASGMAFDRAFVASPACAPSRAALLTGLMPARNGAEANQAAPREDVRKLPAYLHDLGYEVVAFGKVSHYQQTRMYGFDHFEHDKFHDPEGIPSAIRWLKARKDSRPLAIFVGSNWPHVPWPDTAEGYQPGGLSMPPKTVDNPITRDARARYYAAISRLDQEVGDTLQTVDSVLGPDTFVLFSSDHGAQWPFGKWNLYDTGIRVPMIVRWRGHVVPGSRTKAMVSWIDILPTLVDLGGGKPSKAIDGHSFAPLLRSSNVRFKGRSEIYTTHNNDGSVNVYPMRSVRTDQWKYINNLHPEYVYTTHIDQWVKKVDSGKYFPSWRKAAANDPAAKAIIDHYYRRPVEELYDLKADPNEEHNLADDKQHAGVLKSLRVKLAAWRVAQKDDHPVEGTPHFAEGAIDGLPDADAQSRLEPAQPPAGDD